MFKNICTRTALTLAVSIFLSGLLFVDIPAADPAENWEYLTNYDGVDLYRSVEDDGTLLPFKAVAELEIPYEKIVMALVDAEHKDSWAPKLKSTQMHAGISSNSFEYSEYYETPWPFMDREFLLAGTVSYLKDQVVFSAANSKNIHLADQNHLRANIRLLEFAIIPLTETRTRVSFTFSGDLGGWIPSFVKTIIQKKWPVRFIQSLERYIIQADTLETSRYKLLKKQMILMPPGP